MTNFRTMKGTKFIYAKNGAARKFVTPNMLHKIELNDKNRNKSKASETESQAPHKRLRSYANLPMKPCFQSNIIVIRRKDNNNVLVIARHDFHDQFLLIWFEKDSTETDTIKNDIEPEVVCADWRFLWHCSPPVWKECAVVDMRLCWSINITSLETEQRNIHT